MELQGRTWSCRDGKDPWTHPPAELTRQVLRAEARVAPESLEARGSVHTPAVFTRVHLRLAALATVAGLARALEPPGTVGAVSTDARAGDAVVVRLLAGRAGPLGRAPAAVQVEQVLAGTVVLAGAGGTHAGPPAAVPGRRVAVQHGEELLLRSGELQLCVVMERKRKAPDLHRPEATRERHASVQAHAPQEDVCTPLEEPQSSCRRSRGVPLFLVSIRSHDPTGSGGCLVLQAELHAVPPSIREQSPASEGHLVGPSLELHHQA